MAKTLKGYISGSFFNTYIAQSRIDLANQLRSLSNEKLTIEVYNPVETEMNNSQRFQTDETTLYRNNNHYLDEADFIILDLSDHQSDVLVEFGRITTLIEKVNPNLKLYVLWKLALGNKEFYFGVNRYVRGAVEKYSQYYHNEAEILEQFKKDFNL